MAKGVKKIKAVKGTYVKGSYNPERSITLFAGKSVEFNVKTWLEGTTDADKKKELTWIWQNHKRDEIIFQKRQPSSQNAKVIISKKLAGSYYYYLEASLGGKRDSNLVGLYINAYSPPLITKSGWSRSKGNTDLTNINDNNLGLCYGDVVYFHAKTEGLNGAFLTVEVYNEMWNGDYKIRTLTNAEVIDGEINIKISNTNVWKDSVKHVQDNEEFYVKIKDRKGNYIKDSKNNVIFGKYLNIKNKVVSTKSEKPSNQTPVKTGDPDNNEKNYHACKFKTITIDETDLFIVFQEGKTALKKSNSVTKEKSHEVFFDFDQDIIRQDAKHVLDNIFNFLVSNYNLRILLSGHADDRGTIEYNQDLSERRAIAVKNYFFSKGLQKDKITTRGFGEVRPKKQGNTESIYQANRRTEINFSYLEYNADALVYETITSSVKIGKEISISIKDRITNSCFRENEEKHKNEVVIINRGEKTIKTGDAIKQKVVSTVQSDFVPNYFYYLLRFLNPFSILYNSYDVYINTCAYYADKTKPTLVIKSYPDIVWIGHFQYNYTTKGEYFFHNKNLALKTGISDIIDELTNSTVFKVLKVLPSTWILEYVIFEYIKTQAEDFTYGAHVIHERDQELKGQELSLSGKEVNLITQTKYTKYAAAAVVYYFVVLGIVVDLVMIYLTRGKNLKGKVAKIAKKVKGFKKIIDDSGVEIVPPSIAINAGMYYYKQADGKLALIYEANLKANPVVAVDFSRDFDLLKMLDGKQDAVKGKKPVNDKLEQNKGIVLEALKEIGIKELKGSFKVLGEWAMELKVKYNFLTKSYDIKDRIGNIVDNRNAEVIFKEQITVNVTILVEYQKKFFTFIPLAETEVSAKMQLKLNGSAALKTKFDFNKTQGLSMNKTLVFSGIKGTFTGSIKAKNKTFGSLLNIGTDEKKPIEFILIAPHKIDLGTIQFFNQKNN